MLQDKYINLVNEFSKLDVEDKKEEILNDLKELLKILYAFNKNTGNEGLLPILKDYDNDDEFLNVLFAYIMSIKEENAKFLENITNNY